MRWKAATRPLSGTIDEAGLYFRAVTAKLVLMLPRRRIMAGLCLAFGLGAALLASLWLRSTTGDDRLLARIGSPLPPLEVEGIGVAVNLQDFLKGMRKVVVFYSPSCAVCRDVVPALQPFWSDLKLAMIRETGAWEDAGIFEFRQAAYFYDRWHVLPRLFKVPALPVILLVDEQGIIQDGFVGFHERDWIRKRLAMFSESRDMSAGAHAAGEIRQRPHN